MTLIWEGDNNRGREGERERSKVFSTIVHNKRSGVNAALSPEPEKETFIHPKKKLLKRIFGFFSLLFRIGKKYKIKRKIFFLFGSIF